MVFSKISSRCNLKTTSLSFSTTQKWWCRCTCLVSGFLILSHFVIFAGSHLFILAGSRGHRLWLPDDSCCSSQVLWDPQLSNQQGFRLVRLRSSSKRVHLSSNLSPPSYTDLLFSPECVVVLRREALSAALTTGSSFTPMTLREWSGGFGSIITTTTILLQPAPHHHHHHHYYY